MSDYTWYKKHTEEANRQNSGRIWFWGVTKGILLGIWIGYGLSRFLSPVISVAMTTLVLLIHFYHTNEKANKKL